MSKKKKSKKPLRRFLKDLTFALAAIESILHLLNDILGEIVKLLDLLKG